MIITAPSLDTKKNVSGVSSVVRFIIDNNPGRRYIHFELGRQDNERRGPRRLLSLTKALWEWKKLLSKNTEALVHYSFRLSYVTHYSCGQQNVRDTEWWCIFMVDYS